MKPNMNYLSIPMMVNGGSEIEESPALLVELDLDTAATWVNRIEKVVALCQEDRDIFSVTRHEFGLTIFDRGRVELDDVDLYDNGESWVELTPEQYQRIKAEVDKGTTFDADEPGAGIRVECCQEHYLNDMVYFTAVLKHTSIELESQGIRLDTLKSYLDQPVVEEVK